jgi:hypothetical protein
VRGSLGAGILAALLSGALAMPTAAAEESEVDSPLSGFDDEEDPELERILEGFEDDRLESAGVEDTVTPSFWRVSGEVFLGSSYNLRSHRPPPGSAQYSGLSRLRLELDLQLDLELPRSWQARIAGRGFYDFAYRIHGRDNYTDDVLDLYEWEAEFTEVYLQGSLLRDLDLKVGRQVVNWGTGETLRVVDVLNPLDNREPGLVDIEDLRLPVVMTKLDYYLGDWNLSLIAVHERRFNDDPEFGSDFFPPLMGLGLPDREPAQTFENTEWAVALRGILEGWDLGFFAARYYEDMPRVEFPGFVLVDGDPVALPTRHSRLTLLGSETGCSGARRPTWTDWSTSTAPTARRRASICWWASTTGGSPIPRSPSTWPTVEFTAGRARFWTPPTSPAATRWKSHSASSGTSSGRGFT